MITQKPNYSSLKQSEDFPAVKFGIKKEGLAHIFNVLRNQLYTDKILAVIREYSCNAVDAHIEAGNDEPIIVTLPNRMNPNFKVRDFGFGLSGEDIRDVYANYGESTKRNSNAQIGQLGLGCKSAFAYGDNFVINTFQNGVKTSYNAFIDPSQIGQISKMGSEKTEERDGIEIVVPTKGDDHDAFSEKAQRLFKNFKQYPTIKGVKLETYKVSVVLEGKGWRIVKGDGGGYRYGRSYNEDTAVAIMGNIPYPMQSQSIDWQKATDEEDGDLKVILDSNIRIDFEIGDLEIAASREGLQYTEYTQKQVVKRLKKIKDEIIKNIAEKLDNSDSMYEAKKVYGQVFDYGSVLYSLRHLFKENIQFDGVNVDSDNWSCGNEEGIGFKLYKKATRGFKVRPEEAYRIDCEDTKPIVFNDIGLKSGILNRVAPLIECDPNHIGMKVQEVIVITPHDKRKWNKWKKDNGFDAPVVKLSDLPAVKLTEIYGTTNKGTSSYGKNAKHSTKVFTFDADCKAQTWGSKKSDWWKTASVDLENDKGYYVILDKFEYLEGTDASESIRRRPHYLKNLKDTFDELKLKFPKKVYGLKIKMFEDGKNPCGDGMVNLFSYLEQELKNKIKFDNIGQLIRDREVSDQVVNGNHSSWIEALAEVGLSKTLADPNGTMTKFLQAYNEMRHGDKGKAIDGIREVAKQFKIEIESETKGTHDLKKMRAEVDKKYAMINHIDQYQFGWSWKSEGSKGEMCKDIENYINVVDICGTN